MRPDHSLSLLLHPGSPLNLLPELNILYSLSLDGQLHVPFEFTDASLLLDPLALPSCALFLQLELDELRLPRQPLHFSLLPHQLPPQLLRHLRPLPQIPQDLLLYQVPLL